MVGRLESLQKRNDQVEVDLYTTPPQKVIVVKDGTDFYSIHFPEGRILCNLDFMDLVQKLVVIAVRGPAA